MKVILWIFGLTVTPLLFGDEFEIPEVSLRSECARILSDLVNVNPRYTEPPPRDGWVFQNTDVTFFMKPRTLGEAGKDFQDIENLLLSPDWALRDFLGQAEADLPRGLLRARLKIETLSRRLYGDLDPDTLEQPEDHINYRHQGTEKEFRLIRRVIYEPHGAPLSSNFWEALRQSRIEDERRIDKLEEEAKRLRDSVGKRYFPMDQERVLKAAYEIQENGRLKVASNEFLKPLEKLLKESVINYMSVVAAKASVDDTQAEVFGHVMNFYLSHPKVQELEKFTEAAKEILIKNLYPSPQPISSAAIVACEQAADIFINKAGWDPDWTDIAQEAFRLKKSLFKLIASQVSLVNARRAFVKSYAAGNHAREILARATGIPLHYGILPSSEFEFILEQIDKTPSLGFVCFNLLKNYRGWSGDFTDFQKLPRRLKADVLVENFLTVEQMKREFENSREVYWLEEIAHIKKDLGRSGLSQALRSFSGQFEKKAHAPLVTVVVQNLNKGKEVAAPKEAKSEETTTVLKIPKELKSYLDQALIDRMKSHGMLKGKKHSSQILEHALSLLTADANSLLGKLEALRNTKDVRPQTEAALLKESTILRRQIVEFAQSLVNAHAAEGVSQSASVEFLAHQIANRSPELHLFLWYPDFSAGQKNTINPPLLDTLRYQLAHTAIRNSFDIEANTNRESSFLRKTVLVGGSLFGGASGLYYLFEKFWPLIKTGAGHE